MSINTRSKARKHEMTSESADPSRKLDDILAKMDVLITAKNQMLSKLNKLEIAQSTIIKDVEDLKNSFKETDIEIQECNSKLSLKADRTEVEVLKEKIDDLENRSKRNNVVIWGVPEGSKKDFASMEECIEVELLQRHMKLERKIEVMRAHRSSFKARLHRRFLSRQLDAIFVALKLQQVLNMFETPAISRRQIALKIAPGLHVRFWSCNLPRKKLHRVAATKIACVNGPLDGIHLRTRRQSQDRSTCSCYDTLIKSIFSK